MKTATLLLCLLLLLFSTAHSASAQQTPPAPTTPAAPAPSDWYTTCWVCPLLQIAESVRQDFGKRAFLMIGGELAEIVSVFIVLWLMFQVAKLLSPFGGAQSGRTLNDIVKQLMLSIIVLLLANSQTLFWQLLDMIITVGSYTGQVFITTAAEAIPKEMFSLACTPPPLAPGTTQVDGMQALFCQVEIIQRALGIGIKLGVDLWMSNTDVNFLDATVGGVGGNLLQSIAGVALIAVFGYNLISFPFRIIDFMVRIVILTVLAPIFITSFLFPFTRNITFLAARLLFASGMTVVMTAVVVAMYMIGLAAVLNLNGVANAESLQLQDGIASGAFWHLLTLGIMTNILLKTAPNWADVAVSVPMTVQLPMFATTALEKVSSSASSGFNQGFNRLMGRTPLAGPSGMNQRLRDYLGQNIPDYETLSRNTRFKFPTNPAPTRRR